MPTSTSKAPNVAPTPIPAFAPVDNSDLGMSGESVWVLVEAAVEIPGAPGEAKFESVLLVLADELTPVTLARTTSSLGSKATANPLRNCQAWVKYAVPSASTTVAEPRVEQLNDRSMSPVMSSVQDLTSPSASALYKLAIYIHTWDSRMPCSSAKLAGRALS